MVILAIWSSTTDTCVMVVGLVGVATVAVLLLLLSVVAVVLALFVKPCVRVFSRTQDSRTLLTLRYLAGT